MCCYIFQGGTGVPFPPLLLCCLAHSIFPSLFALSGSEFISGMRCRGGVFLFVRVCWRGRVGGNWVLVSWVPYRKRLIPTPSYHWGRCTLIRCAGTQDPRIQWWVARNLSKYLVTNFMFLHKNLIMYFVLSELFVFISTSSTIKLCPSSLYLR